VPVKAHRNGAKNPLAHFQKEISVETVSNGRIVSDPLTLYDCCPTSDGAAALVVMSKTKMRELGCSDRAIKVLGVGHGTDFHAVQHRLSLTSFGATVEAARNAFRMANLQPSAIDVAEIHDAFSILELVNMEDIGFVDSGEAIGLVRDGSTQVEGNLPINPSGGLKARGHPTGATGVAQIRDVVLQLRNESPKGLQVDSPKLALTHNIGGFGNNMVVAIFGVT